MNIAPIPKKLLCHSAVLTVKYEPDIWGKPREAASSPLENVRFEPVSRNERTVTQNGAPITAKMFFDCRNSSCGLPILRVGDEYGGSKITSQTVTYEGREYNIEEVRTFFAFGGLTAHHLEVLLSG